MSSVLLLDDTDDGWPQVRSPVQVANGADDTGADRRARPARANEYPNFHDDLINQFARPASKFALIATEFTHQAMLKALMSCAAAMDALGAGDAEEFACHAEDWDSNFQLALKRHQAEHEAYLDARELMKIDLAWGMSKAAKSATRADDKISLQHVENGMRDEWSEVNLSRHRMMIEIARHWPRIHSANRRIRNLLARGNSSILSESANRAIVQSLRTLILISRRAVPADQKGDDPVAEVAPQLEARDPPPPPPPSPPQTKSESKAVELEERGKPQSDLTDRKSHDRAPVAKPVIELQGQLRTMPIEVGIEAAAQKPQVIPISGRQRRSAPRHWASIAMVLMGFALTSFVFSMTPKIDLVAQHLALDTRASELELRSIQPGPALGCLDGIAGDTVEDACEKKLFATSDAVTAALSYVSTQLSLLADTVDYARRGGKGLDGIIAKLRRAAETDRFGIVAHLLAKSGGCTASQCAAFALFNNTRRIQQNLAEGTFDYNLGRNSEAWPRVAISPPDTRGADTASPPSELPPRSTPVASKVPRSDVFFPSAKSIPPISIMVAEPVLTERNAPAPARAQAPPARRPAQPDAPPSQAPGQAPGQPLNLNATAR
jgi:hypothetical protein